LAAKRKQGNHRMASKSSADSSTKATQTTESRQQDATGVTGTVVQGQTIDIQGLSGSDIERVFNSIGEAFIKPTLEAAGTGVQAIQDSAGLALRANKDLARPDLASVQDSNKTLVYAVGGVAIIALFLFLRKK
jgi:hypothetical protein